MDNNLSHCRCETIENQALTVNVYYFLVITMFYNMKRPQSSPQQDPPLYRQGLETFESVIIKVDIRLDA